MTSDGFPWVNFHLQTTASLNKEQIIGGSSALPMWLTDGFFGHFFWKMEGTARTHLSHVQLLYTVITLEGEDIRNIGKFGKFKKLKIWIKVEGSIGSHIGSHMAAILNY